MEAPRSLCPGRLGRDAVSIALVVFLGFLPGVVRAESRTRSPHGSLGIECAACHTSERWVPLSPRAPFRHEKVGFPLEGRHAQASCRSCHKSLVLSQIGTSCVDCHRDPHLGGLGPRCDTCHTPKTFRTPLEILKVHDRSRLPLFARHAVVGCVSCHRSQRPHEYASTPTACAACHQKTAALVKSPNHVRAGFTQSCETCHTVAARGWLPTSFKHPATFPLRGAHAALQCAACHAERFKGTPRDCVGCHLQAYNAAKNPNHLASGFPTQCAACHRETSWRPATFTDHSKTRFPLTGAHERVDCARCHVGGKFTGTTTDCYGCHRPSYEATQRPNHPAAGFRTQCATCHGTGAWQPASFDHSRTRFALTGAHQRVACTPCHRGGRFRGTPSDCYSCHEADYRRTTNPNHVARGFPTQCASCHNTTAFRSAAGANLGPARLPLGGADRPDPGKARLLPEGVDRSVHGQARFSRGGPDRPDHARTRFPLTGAHLRVDCARCHLGGRYPGTPTDCRACHQRQYQSTTNPNHAAAGFLADCASCHTTRAWTPATFDHDGRFFPIHSGNHRAVWQGRCATCHVSPGSYRAFECIFCHQHADKARVDSLHRPVAGYTFQSTACYRCHLRGRR